MSQIERWACYYPELGYLRFASYSQATVSDVPDPRGLFVHRRHAELRQQRKWFWVQPKKYPGAAIVIRKVRITIDVEDEDL